MADDPALDNFQQWQLGIAVLIGVVVVAALAATALQVLSIPFGTEIGTVGGAIVAFLAFSYWFYGR
ncbi:hypothetical protein ACFQDG_06400 [Natronoarchaeum mannanilyticum]|uniref:DUF8144 domain-containing protein n=1 Tax=Natronoarchaeum mannanilyticum TaxID=926360 RepID=A0AAV3TAM4_9EURY